MASWPIVKLIFYFANARITDIVVLTVNEEASSKCAFNYEAVALVQSFGISVIGTNGQLNAREAFSPMLLGISLTHELSTNTLMTRVRQKTNA